jgi:hypothetical protein
MGGLRFAVRGAGIIIFLPRGYLVRNLFGMWMMAGWRGCKILISFGLRLKSSKHRGLGRDLRGMGQLPPDSATGRGSIGDGFRRICALLWTVSSR